MTSLLVERFLAAVRAQRRAAVGLLRRHHELAAVDPFTAAAAGDAEALAAKLAADPAGAHARHPPDGWTPLLYAAASPLAAASNERAAGARRCAELLLDHGADPNSSITFAGPDGEGQLPALFFACTADNTPVVELLLRRGADPNDGESLYHAAERNHRRCLELLRRHGAELSRRHPRWGNTPLYFLAGWREPHPMALQATAGMSWLLENGADPNITSGAGDETPLHRVAAGGGGPKAGELLLAYGAVVDPRRSDGRTPYALAVRAGDAALAALLQRHGAETALSPVDQLLGACMAADSEAAQALLDRDPGLVGRLTDEDRQALAVAAEWGRAASVRLMVELGFDLGWEGQGGGTALHQAAWHGDLEMVQQLLALGAPIDQRDRTYGCSPVAWAAHGSANCRRADRRYRAVVDLLLDAGATRPPAFNRWGEPPESLASRAVAERLRQRGFAA